MSWAKGYKAFNKVDGEPKKGECNGFIYEEGETYEIEGELKLCSNGFHACKDWVLCLAYYPEHENNLYAEIEFLGDIEYEEPTKHKGASSKIKIVRFIECCFLDGKNSGDYNSGDYNSGDCNSGNRNSGYRNSGYRNSGDCNSGDCNSGDCNSGDCNSGDYNSGDWNSCDRSSGFFNSESQEEILVFNKACSLSDWEAADKPSFLYFNVDKDIGYKESFKKSFESATRGDIEKLKALPNFEADVFFEISGIDLRG